jgi:hypothetical protein
MHITAAWIGFCAAIFTISIPSCLAQDPQPLPNNPTVIPGQQQVAQFGFDRARAVTFSSAQAPQTAVFADGLTFAVQAAQPVQMNVGLQRGLGRTAIPLGLPSLSM